MFNIIAAVCQHNNGIGYRGSMPWGKIKKDMDYFKRNTTGNIVIMGRATWQSLPDNGLPGRELIVITHYTSHYKNLEKTNQKTSQKTNSPKTKNITFVSSFKKALQIAARRNITPWVIGGGEIYKEAVKHPKCKYIHITEISNEDWINELPLCDTYFPKIPEHFEVLSSYKTDDGPYELNFKIYQNVWDLESQEYQYLNSMFNILENGEIKKDRTGTGTKSIFGETLRFRLYNSTQVIMPLLTTKKMFWRGVVEELLFFLRGDVDSHLLESKGINIWKGNTSREFLDGCGLDYMEAGALGKSYGWQWRRAGAPWMGKSFDYSTLPFEEQGVDQIKDVIKLLLEQPHSRRIVLNAWNPVDLNEMCLPPCHMIYVFNTSFDKNTNQTRLNCHMTQRSGDMFLGIPFNIASVSLLTTIIATAVGMQPGEIMISVVDAHIYLNHIEQTKEQLTRKPYCFPTIEIPKLNAAADLQKILRDIESLKYEDIIIKGYKCHPHIKAVMAV